MEAEMPSFHPAVGHLQALATAEAVSKSLLQKQIVFVLLD
jgi:hypothetical protein